MQYNPLLYCKINFNPLTIDAVFSTVQLLLVQFQCFLYQTVKLTFVLMGVSLTHNQQFSKCVEGTLAVPQILSGGSRALNYFSNKTKLGPPFSLSFSHKWIVGFSRCHMTCDTGTEAGRTTQLSSLKPGIKEIPKMYINATFSLMFLFQKIWLCFIKMLTCKRFLKIRLINTLIFFQV